MKKLISILFVAALVVSCSNQPQQKETTEPCCTKTIKLAEGVIMHPEYVKAIGQMAYVWGWPIVNSHNRRAGITEAPEPGKLGGVVPVAPRGRLSMLNDYVEPNQSFVACPNQDVVYGTAFCALDEEPVVLQLPDFGDRFWIVALYNARTDQFGELGKAYGTKSGFYLLVGPNWDGVTPEGITEVIQSTTEFCFAGPRIFLNDTKEDREAIKPIVNQINAYPLADFDGEMKIVDWDETPSFPAPEVEGERSWVVPEVFFKQLSGIMDLVPPMPGEEAMYASIRQVLSAAEEDPEVMSVLVETAIETENNIINPLMLWKHNGVPAEKEWNRSVNNANWGFDYLMRTACAKSNMFENRSSETQYYYTDNDIKKETLKGDGIYSITFEKGNLPPVNGFWSLTVYNKHHLFEVNDKNKYALGTRNKDIKFNKDGSLTLYVGPKPPSPDMESNWLEAPKDDFSLYIRAYWSKEAILDGNWIPPVIEKVN